ncbi:MAG: hypothetical protein JW881_16800 [Spirochaetales bacterium]|nr:hypothetical protein [Spirochaetales bacterium]
METYEIEFSLPLGFIDNEGTLQRKGKMRPATAHDEIVIQRDERNLFNKRYRDLLVLSQVITRLGDYVTVTTDILENLYEVDFIYLQMLYRELNSPTERKIVTRCPACGNADEIRMAKLFDEMHYYYKGENPEEGETVQDKGGSIKEK